MVNDLFIKRRSYRKYLSKEVEEEKIHQILEAGMLAPIANGKYYNVILKVFKGEELRILQDTLVKEAGNDNTYKAPLVIAVYHKGENIELANLDVGAIIENMLLEARDLGLGSVFIYSICRLTRSNEALKKYNELDGGYILRSVISVGYVEDFNDVREVEHRFSVIK